MLKSLNLKDKNVVTGQQTQVGHRRLSAGTQVTSILFWTIMEKKNEDYFGKTEIPHYIQMRQVH